MTRADPAFPFGAESYPVLTPKTGAREMPFHSHPVAPGANSLCSAMTLNFYP